MGEDLCQGLIKIHVNNASNLNPDFLYACVNFSHPVLVERLRALGFHGVYKSDEMIRSEYDALKKVDEGDEKKDTVTSTATSTLKEPLLK